MLTINCRMKAIKNEKMKAAVKSTAQKRNLKQ